MQWRHMLYNSIDFVSFTIFVFGIILFLRFFIVNPFTVMGQSMEPTIHQRDFIFVNKYDRFLGREIKRGDIVVIVPPIAHGTPYIKRVIGLPGDIVSLSGGSVYLGSGDSLQLYDESVYLPSDVQTTVGRSLQKATFIVPDNEYFVMGDNRNNSTDSRDCFYRCIGDASHTVAQEDIVGVVALRLFPNFSLPSQL